MAKPIRIYTVTAKFKGQGKDDAKYIREFAIAAENKEDAKFLAYNRLPLYLTSSAIPNLNDKIDFSIIDNGIVMNNKTYYSSPIFPVSYKNKLPEPSINMPIPPDTTLEEQNEALINTYMLLSRLWGQLMIIYVSHPETSEQLYLGQKMLENINSSVDLCKTWAKNYLESNSNQDLEEFFNHKIQAEFNSADNRNEKLDSDYAELQTIKAKNIELDSSIKNVHTDDESVDVHTDDESVDVHTDDESVDVHTDDESVDVHTDDESVDVHTDDESVDVHTDDESNANNEPPNNSENPQGSSEYKNQYKWEYDDISKSWIKIPT